MFWDVFFVFTKISLSSFGGVFAIIPEIERLLVKEKGWVTSEEFLQIYALGQFLPGPNMSMCPIIGYKVGGWSGFWGGFLGIYLIPIILVGLVWFFYSKVRNLQSVQKIEQAMRPTVLGLMIASTLRVFYLSSGGIDIAQTDRWIFFTVSLFFGIGILAAIQKSKWVTTFNSIFLFAGLWMLTHLSYWIF
jgi:chromate transport protein ChrA